MYGSVRIAVVIPVFNEARRLRQLIPAIPADLVDETIVVNDRSTDATSEIARALGAYVIDRAERGGPGPAIRAALDVLRRGEGPKADVVVVMAANGKHDPGQIGDMVRPLIDQGCDLVRGSRFLDGGGHANMPWHRLLLIRLFTRLSRIALAQPITDATGGYQAYRLSILDDPSIDLHQSWLRRYEVETYLMAKTLLGGYRWREVPIWVTYPDGGVYTRARAIVDWWAYFRPIVLLRLRLKY